jgi:hypothetical protein
MKTLLLALPLLGALSLVAAGCSRTSPDPGAARGVERAPATPPKAADAPPPATALDPCALLGLADVRKALPGAEDGVRDRGDEAHGIMLCSWSGPGGRIALQLHDAPPAAAAREIQERSIGLIDPRNANAASAVRIEVVTGVGDATLAVAEPVDDARGIRRADAIVVTQTGFRVVTISAPALAAGDRALALSTLAELARTATGNL